MSIIINPAYKCPIEHLNHFILEIEITCKEKMIEKIQVMAKELLEREVNKDDLEKKLSEYIKRGFTIFYNTNPYFIESGVNIFLDTDEGFAYIVPYEDAGEILYNYPLPDYVEDFSWDNRTENHSISKEESEKREKKWKELWLKNDNFCQYEKSFTTAHPRILMFYQLIDEAIESL